MGRRWTGCTGGRRGGRGARRGRGRRVWEVRHKGSGRSKPQIRFDGAADVSFVSLPMHLTKQQKIVGAVLVVAVAAFMAARFVSGRDDDAAPVASAKGPQQPARPARRTVTRPAKVAQVVAGQGAEA